LSAGATGATATDPTASGGTVIVAVALFPSLVAVIVAVPGATAVTTPAVETVATAVLPELQATARPVSTFPSASFIVAVNVVVCPTMTVAAVWLRVTVATGAGETPTVAVPLCPSLVAVIVALPGVTPVTVPVAETVATLVLLELHVTGRSGTSVPATSRITAVSWTLAFCRIALVAGCTLTLPTAKFETVTVAVALLPSVVAVIVAVPGATAVSIPCGETVAIALSELDHVTGRPVSAVPLASRAIADSCVD